MTISKKQPHAFWSDSEMLECVDCLPEAPNVMTFCFQSPSGALFNYQPGQFLTLKLPLPDGPIYRTYTISSSPSRSTSITITAKAQENSIGTRWMFEHLRPGIKIHAIGPAGGFTYLNHLAKKYLFISAGSGITPMSSMTTHLYDAGRRPDIVFINCARSPSEIIFRKRLEFMASRVTSIDLKWVVEKSDPYTIWTGYRGYFNQLMLGLMAPDYLEREVFCCGPEPFMQAVREALADMGFDMTHYHQESFSAPIPETEDVPIFVIAENNNAACIEFTLSDKKVDCAKTDSILMVARKVGIRIPSSCSMGLCGTCKVKKSFGEVHMVHNGGITDEEIEEGYLLACCSKPIGKVKIIA